MAPSLRDIRRAAKQKRKAEGEGPAHREAIAKVAKKIDAGEPSKRAEAEGRPHSPPASSPIDLTCSPPKQGGEEAPLPPAAPEAGSATAAPAPEAEVAMSAEGAGTAEPAPTEVPVAQSDAEPAPAATGSSEEEIDVSFRSILSRYTRWAEESVTEAAEPRIQKLLQSQGSSVFFREASVAHLWALNSLVAMKNLWSTSQVVLDHSLEEVQDVKARAEAALMRVEEEIARARKAEAEADAARLRATKAEDMLETAQRKAASELDNALAAEEKQKEAEDKLKTAEDKLKIVESKLKAAESTVFMLENRLQSANIEIGVAEERAENAEEIARHRDAETMTLRAAVAEAEAKASEAGKKAVEDFRKSTAYDRELAETTAFAYNGGFRDCKEKVRRLYGLEGIETLQPDEEDSGSDHAEP